VVRVTSSAGKEGPHCPRPQARLPGDHAAYPSR